MLELLARRPAFRRLFLAGTISLVGDWLSLVAVSLLAVRGDGGALTLALDFAAHARPAALGATLAGPVVDRFDRRRVLLAAQVGQGAVTWLMVVAAAHGAVLSLSALLIVRSALSALVVPAEAAALRRVVEPAELVLANTLLASVWSVTFVVGMALGGALAMLGPTIAIALDACSFLIAALLIRGLPEMPVERVGARMTSMLLAVPADWVAAVRRARTEPALLRAMLSKAPLGLAGGAAWIALNLVASSAHPFGSAALSLGLLQALRGAGTGIGPMVARALLARRWGVEAVAHGAVAIALGSMLIVVGDGGAILLALAALAWGVGSGTNWVISTVALQRLAPDEMMGRLSSLDELLTSTAMVASAVAAGAWVARGHSIRAAVIASTLGGAAAWIALLPRSGQRLQAADAAPTSR